MQPTRYNISKPRKYIDRYGNEKTAWNNVGTLTEFHKQDGSVSRLIEIPAIGLEAQVFPIQPREGDERSHAAQPARHDAPSTGPLADETPDEINPDDIPFNSHLNK